MFRTLSNRVAQNRRVLSLVLSAIVSVVGVIYVSSPTIVRSQDQEAPQPWRVGKDLDRYTTAGFSRLMSGAELGLGLRRLAASQRVGLFIDRRIDPSLKLNISIQNGTLEQFFWGIADSHDLGVCRIGDLYYMAPKEVAAALPLAWQRLKKDDSDRRSKSKVPWTDREILSSKTVVGPKKLLKELADKHGFQIENLDQMPHDLWAPFEIPPTSLEGRVAILLTGFGKWFERSDDGTSIKIIDFPKIDKGQINLGQVQDPRATAKRLKAKFRSLTISATGKSLTASGPALDLLRLKAAVVKEQTPPAGTKKANTFSLRTTASRGGILASLAKQTNRKFVYERPAPKALREQIEIAVKDLTIEQIAEEVAKGTSLSIDITDSEIVIK